MIIAVVSEDYGQEGWEVDVPQENETSLQNNAHMGKLSPGRNGPVNQCAFSSGNEMKGAFSLLVLAVFVCFPMMARKMKYVIYFFSSVFFGSIFRYFSFPDWIYTTAVVSSAVVLGVREIYRKKKSQKMVE